MNKNNTNLAEYTRTNPPTPPPRTYSVVAIQCPCGCELNSTVLDNMPKPSELYCSCGRKFAIQVFPIATARQEIRNIFSGLSKYGDLERWNDSLWDMLHEHFTHE